MNQQHNQPENANNGARALFKIPSTRRTNLIIFAGCTALLAFAIFMEHVMRLEPCPLCITQRIIIATIGILAFLAWLQHPARIGQRIYASLYSVICALGIGVAGRHVWLQNLPEDKAPACGPDLMYMIDALPLQDVLSLLFKGDGNCADVVASFLGLSIPGWTLVAFVGLLGISLWQLIRK